MDRFDLKLIPEFDGSPTSSSVVEWVEKAKCVCKLFRIKESALVIPLRLMSGRKRQQETDSCINSREDTVVSVTLSPSLSVAVPSFFLSLSFRSSPSFLPSFLLFFLAM